MALVQWRMDLLQDLFDRLPISTANSTGSGAGSRANRVYRCTNYECTFTSKLERCRECETGRLARSGPALESEPGLTCRSCGATVDYGYEHCPECGRPPFDGG